MKLCPNKNIEIVSPLSKAEVIEKLKQTIEYRDQLGILGIRHKSFRDYEGYIDDDKIIFRRILKLGANSFIPQISGQIIETNNETTIKLNARLHKVIEGFVIVFHSFILLLFIAVLISFDASSELSSHILFLTGLIVMIILVNGMTRIIFNFEMYRLEKDFRRVLISSDKRPSNDNRLNRIIENSSMIPWIFKPQIMAAHNLRLQQAALVPLTTPVEAMNTSSRNKITKGGLRQAQAR